MNPLKVLKDSLPALLTVFERILEELEELNESNKEILEVLKKNEKENNSDIIEDKGDSEEGA